ncbi:peptidoglycan-binding protein [Christensenellaceae bacterium OttesenSCG-928-K19]|nr:peptidoglycan-binding protein [Christensenellaceae bacterium OttesenSCG-928-K19]
MKKHVLIFLVILLATLPLLGTTSTESTVVQQGDAGSEVYAIQRRLCELGYLNYRPTGKFSDMTAQSVRQFQQINGISPDGQVGRATMQAIFSDSAVRNTPNPEFKRVFGITYTGEITEKGTLSAWETINSIYRTGDVITITDYNSGITFDMKRVGGINCAQIIPNTEEDYAAYQEIFRGETWEHRAVLANIKGANYAASLFGMPSGTETLNSSGMVGYTILYFNNSKTDIYEIADEEHLLAITGIS